MGSIDPFARALSDLGVDERTLSPDDKRALDEQGYTLLRAVTDGAHLEAMRLLCDRWRDDEAALHQGGNRQLSALSERHEPLVRAVLAPALLAAAWQVLRRPFQLGGVAFRDPRPGHGQQALHADWGFHPDADTHHVVTALWLLDAFTPENGATRVVPATHRRPGQVPKRFADPKSRHPDERTITSPEGALLVFNGHLWHSGTQNHSNGPRRALQISFHARDAGGVPSTRIEPLARLSPAAQLVLGSAD